ncbi:HDIG domain-containing protein [Paenibacillus albiflavus]|uniref:HDIG domain-containing protein n=1 Tax=Paenibacillus albiflavus TaxID=2545760 RepID=A0A4R4E9A6_9BACL|nr:HDIG domain-containing metalloprotein [Paenibacillus albiflavus]TCZ75583.1 HDIG domain-containing protein [Paenibacillus albiflavus]
MKQQELNHQDKKDMRLAGWKNSYWVRLLLFALMGIIFYVSLLGPLVPQKYDIQLGQPAEKTIYAPKQIENEEATDMAKEDAAKKVPDDYKNINFKNEQAVYSVYSKINAINGDIETKFEDKVNLYRTVITSVISEYQAGIIKNFSDKKLYSEELIAEIRQKVNDQTYKIPEEVLYKVPRLTADDINEMLPVSREIVARLMMDQINDAQTVRAKVAEQVNMSTLTKASSREIAQEIIKAVIMPNKFFDEKGTNEAKAKARESVKPIYINKGEELIRAGTIITQDKYDMLEKNRLLKDKANYSAHIGLLLIIFLCCMMLYMLARHMKSSIHNNNSQLLMLVVIFTLTLIVMKIFGIAQNVQGPNIAFLAPVAMGTMLIVILLDVQLAFVSSVLFALFASIIFDMEHIQPFDYSYGFITLVICCSSIFMIQKASQRSTILKAGGLISFFSVLAIVAIMLLSNSEITSKEALLSLAFGAGGGVLTSMVVIGLLPFFELAFGILSPLKMVEISNPNHPLLRKLLTETPGTYHHSIMVGNLSEAAAEAIGADGLLCRVGSYYHDIGKTKRPSYFIENQTNIENPHDRIEPELSKSIIIAHPRDGVEMLKEYKIPKLIQDIAMQHHGTTFLGFFYHKAKKLAESEGRDPSEVTEEQFRYPGPKAQSKEAAIVGIADSVEAAVRSLRNPTMEQIDSMVHKIIKSRLDDGQFNECDLTLKELDVIAKTLNEALLGIFHSRIEYPSDTKTEVKANG